MASKKDEELDAATRRVVATHLSLYRDSCVTMAIEAWRMWNEFPDQRGSVEFRSALEHYGNADAVMDDITLVMSTQLASPTPMFLDDAFILRELFNDCISVHTSSFIYKCIMSTMRLKFGEHAAYHSLGGNALRNYNVRACFRCDSGQMMRDLAAYIARKRLQSL
jgi:hypothetical protein